MTTAIMIKTTATVTTTAKTTQQFAVRAVLLKQRTNYGDSKHAMVEISAQNVNSKTTESERTFERVN